MTDSKELLPCKVCGEKNYIVFKLVYNNYGPANLWVAECITCNALIPALVSRFGGNPAEALTTAWNKENTKQ